MFSNKVLITCVVGAVFILTAGVIITQKSTLSNAEIRSAASASGQRGSSVQANDDRAIDRVFLQRARPSSNNTPLSPIEALKAFQKERQIKNGTQYFKNVSYVGAKACSSCHQEQYTEWSRTWHAKMEQWPTTKTVIGEFDGQIITYKNVKVKSKDGKRVERVTFNVRAFQKGGKYYYTVIDQDNARNNQTFKIEKTLGGKWDQGYEILVGKNYYPALLRYSNTGGGWLVKSFKPGLWIEADGTKDGRPRRLDELPMHRVAEAKCAGCHTTAYDYKKDTKGIWQFEGKGQLGVGCEKCHGPGALHIKQAKLAKASGKTFANGDMKIVHGLKDLDFQQQNQLCAQCHGRASNRQDKSLAFPLDFRPGDMDITEKLVFWNYQSTYSSKQTKYFYRNNWAKRNREQWQDHQLSTHFTKAGMSCLTCHTVHGKWKNMQLRMEPQKMCTSCHNSNQRVARPQAEMFAGSKMEQAGVECINCHMARIGFRSHLTKATEKNKHFPMDGSSHHYLVPTPAIKKAYGVRTACEACHSKGRKMPASIDDWVTQHVMDDDELDKRLNTIQANTQSKINVVRIGLRSLSDKVANKALSYRKKAKVEQARSNLNFVLLDGSRGFHNRKKAMAKLDGAVALLKEAGASFVVRKPKPKKTIPKLIVRKKNRSPDFIGPLLPSGQTIDAGDKQSVPTKKASKRVPAVVLVSNGKILRIGDSGSRVKALQGALRRSGYQVALDGNFGGRTRRALRKFQRQAGLPVDGTAGPQTLQALATTTQASTAKKPKVAPKPDTVEKTAGRIVGKISRTLPPPTFRPDGSGAPDASLVHIRNNTSAINSILKLTDSGRQVRSLQRLLINLGYKLTMDGQFGGSTRRAVRKFQRKVGLSVDGVVGPATLAALVEHRASITAAVRVPTTSKSDVSAPTPSLIK